jgi:hypothetical protein
MPNANNSAIMTELLHLRQERPSRRDVAASVSEKAVRIGGLLALILVVGGCTEMHGVRPLRPLELATSAYSETITSAQVGSLMLEGDCLLFRQERTGAPLLPVWPAGTVFNGTAVIFHRPAKADQPIVIAEQFVMSGQAVAWSHLPASYAPFQHQCEAPPFFVSSVRPAN